MNYRWAWWVGFGLLAFVVGRLLEEYLAAPIGLLLYLVGLAGINHFLFVRTHYTPNSSLLPAVGLWGLGAFATTIVGFFAFPAQGATSGSLLIFFIYLAVQEGVPLVFKSQTTLPSHG